MCHGRKHACSISTFEVCLASRLGCFIPWNPRPVPYAQRQSLAWNFAGHLVEVLARDLGLLCRDYDHSSLGAIYKLSCVL